MGKLNRARTRVGCNNPEIFGRAIAVVCPNPAEIWVVNQIGCVCVRVRLLMSNDNAGWELDVRGPQIAPHKSEILDLESRVNWSEHFERDIKQTRFETARIANELEHRIREQGQLIQGQGRLIRFLADVVFAVIAALFGGLAAAYVHGDI